MQFSSYVRLDKKKKKKKEEEENERTEVASNLQLSVLCSIMQRGASPEILDDL